MAHLVELPLSVPGDAGDLGGAGGAVLRGRTDVVQVQIEEVPARRVEVARPGLAAARAARSLNDMLAGIRPVVEDFVAAFCDMPDGPDEIGVEFGLAFTADAELAISRITGQGGFTVTVTWRRPSERVAR
ncbi:CU044_2847 family protein [Actinacidiphila glaucinigra]|uniref:CU044_2847 family protein n=1 Tax=Actinacidiphila glaucinigra TaxID=235986 RepID=UPI0037C7F592